jgi:hypothetical protein
MIRRGEGKGETSEGAIPKNAIDSACYANEHPQTNNLRTEPTSDRYSKQNADQNPDAFKGKYSSGSRKRKVQGKHGLGQKQRNIRDRGGLCNNMQTDADGDLHRGCKASYRVHNL